MAAAASGVVYNAPAKGVVRSEMTWMEDYLCGKMSEHLGEQLNIGCLCYLSKDVSRAQLKERLLATLMKFERLRSRIVRDNRGNFFFEDHGDAEEVIDSMIFETELQKGEDADFLQQLRDNTTLNTWHPDKPHWDVHIVRGITKRAETKDCSVALYFRLDHTLGDGQALLHALLSVCEAESGGILRLPVAARKDSSVMAKIGNAITSFVFGLLYHTVMFLPALCVALSSRVLADTPSVLKLKMALPQRVAKRNFALTPAFDLAVLKSLGRAHGCTVNDLAITWVAGALRRFLLRKGDPSVAADREVGNRQRAVFAFNRHAQVKPGGAVEFANHVVFLPVPLPVAVPELGNRIQRVRDATRFIKKTLVAYLTHGLMYSLSAIPVVGRKVLGDEVKEGLVRITSSFSSLAGPVEKVSICGASVEYMAVTVNPATVGLSFTAFSYAGMVTMSATTHPLLVKSSEMIACVEEEFQGFKEEVATLANN